MWNDRVSIHFGVFRMHILQLYIQPLIYQAYSFHEMPSSDTKVGQTFVTIENKFNEDRVDFSTHFNQTKRFICKFQISSIAK